MAKDMTITLSEEDYHDHCNSHDGFCPKCGEVSYGGFEPDAENYKCQYCGEMSAMGMENALVSMLVDIEEE